MGSRQRVSERANLDNSTYILAPDHNSRYFLMLRHLRLIVSAQKRAPTTESAYLFAVIWPLLRDILLPKLEIALNTHNANVTHNTSVTLN